MDPCCSAGSGSGCCARNGLRGSLCEGDERPGRGAPGSVPTVARTLLKLPPPACGSLASLAGGGGWLLARLKPSRIGEEKIMGTRKTAGRRGRAAGARWEATAPPIGGSPPEAGRLEDSASPDHAELRLGKASLWIAPTAREP